MSRLARIPLALRILLAALLTATVLWSFAERSSVAESQTMGSAAPAPAATPVAGKPPATVKGPFAVVLVIDAARADELNLAQMPNLAALAAQGATYPDAWVGQLPSITESSHATIGTGVFPRHHLILGDTWRIPGTSQMSPNLLDGTLTRTGYIGKVIQQANVPTLAGAVHQGDPASRVVAISGHKIYAADALGAGAADYVAFGTKDSRGHYVPAAIPGREPAESILKSPQLDLPTYPRVEGVEDDWTATLALKFLFKYHPKLLMVNFPEVDTFGHAAGTNATIIEPLIANIDHEIGRLVAAYTRAGIINQTDWIITADHGMVPAVHTIDSETIKNVVLHAGGQPLYIGHGDYCPIWLKNLDAVPRVAAALSTAAIPNVDAVFAKSPQGKYMLVSPPSRLANPNVQKTYSSLLGTLNQGESPDIVLMYDENTITLTPAFRQAGRKGDHEGATWGAQHIPLYLAGPGIKHGIVSAFPARLVDIAPTVEALLGVPLPAGQDGVPLADVMVHPPAAALTLESKRAPKLQSVVQALISEASLRPNLR